MPACKISSAGGASRLSLARARGRSALLSSVPSALVLIAKNSVFLLGDYVIDNELIVVNGLITLAGLLLISKPASANTKF